MENHTPFRHADQPNKLKVIFCPDTIIQPFAVMIKHLNTSSTFFTMEWVPAHKRLTYPTIKFMSCWIEHIPFLDCFFM